MGLHEEKTQEGSYKFALQHIVGQSHKTTSPMPTEWGRYDGIIYQSRAIPPYTLSQLRKGEKVNFSENGSYIIGKEGFNWREELSAAAQILYPWLLGGMGHRSILEHLAEKHKFNLAITVAELQTHSIIEVHPHEPDTIRLIRKRLS